VERRCGSASEGVRPGTQLPEDSRLAKDTVHPARDEHRGIPEGGRGSSQAAMAFSLQSSVATTHAQPGELTRLKRRLHAPSPAGYEHAHRRPAVIGDSRHGEAECVAVGEPVHVMPHWNATRCTTGAGFRSKQLETLRPRKSRLNSTAEDAPKAEPPVAGPRGGGIAGPTSLDRHADMQELFPEIGRVHS